jgi:hypothetical protein
MPLECSIHSSVVVFDYFAHECIESVGDLLHVVLVQIPQNYLVHGWHFQTDRRRDDSFAAGLHLRGVFSRCVARMIPQEVCCCCKGNSNNK